jgi:hypothetical protein
MWKLIAGIGLSLLASCSGEVLSSEPAVTVEFCGRLRHGLMAIGGETTGTTIAAGPVIWELELSDDAERAFAEDHHKKQVVVTGKLRTVAGQEMGIRRIIEVLKIAKADPAKNREGVQVSVEGILLASDAGDTDTKEMTIEAGGQIWVCDFSGRSQPKLKVTAQSLVGQPVRITGSPETPPKQSGEVPVQIKVQALRSLTER